MGNTSLSRPPLSSVDARAAAALAALLSVRELDGTGLLGMTDDVEARAPAVGRVKGEAPAERVSGELAEPDGSPLGRPLWGPV